ncbi:MAG: hypothetical protein AAGJ97_15815, partial [Planctomycetota bacterium]
MSRRIAGLFGITLLAASAPAEAQVVIGGGPYYSGFGTTTAYYGGTSAFAYRPVAYRATPFAAPYASPLDPLGWFSPASPLGVVNPFNYTAGYYGRGFAPATTVGFGPSYAAYGFGGACGCGAVSPCGSTGCGTGSCGANFTPANVPTDDPIDDEPYVPEDPIRERTFDSDAAPYDPSPRPGFDDRPRPGFDRPVEPSDGFDRSRAPADDGFGGFRRDNPAPGPAAPAGSGTRTAPESAPPFNDGFSPAAPADDGFGGFGGDSFGAPSSSEDGFGGFGEPSSGSSSSFKIPNESRAPTDVPIVEDFVPAERPAGEGLDGVPPLGVPESARAVDRLLAETAPAA